jgi:hypothetical protein
MQKFDVVNKLVERYQLRRYLEIATPTTGHKYADIEKSPLICRDRLMYNCPEFWSDGQDVAYRTILPTSLELIRTIFAARRGEPAYDVIFVDPFHTASCSAADIAGAWMLLQPGGWMVVHDCNPSDPQIAEPEFRQGEWCGVTYSAYIDFLFSHPWVEACTVDADYGCGVLRKPDASQLFHRIIDRDPILELEWLGTLGDWRSRFVMFHQRRKELLNLVNVDEFSARYIEQPMARIGGPSDHAHEPLGA